MARKPNYNFEKRRKELDRKAKQTAKQDEKLRRKRESLAGEPGDAATAPAPESESRDEPQ